MTEAELCGDNLTVGLKQPHLQALARKQQSRQLAVKPASLGYVERSRQAAQLPMFAVQLKEGLQSHIQLRLFRTLANIDAVFLFQSSCAQSAISPLSSGKSFLVRRPGVRQH